MIQSLSLLLVAQLLQASTVRAQAEGDSVWEFNINWGPAPSPEDGPPDARFALRDRSKLKYEIAGIAASYVLVTSIIFGLFFTIGKRRRREALANKSLDMEMVKPGVNQAAIGVKPSPVESSNQWPSPVSDDKPWQSPTSKYPHTYGNSHHYSQASVSTFDDKVIEYDRLRNQNEMERLYAAVMVHDEEKASQASASEIGVALSPPGSPTYPPELQHLRTMNGSTQNGQQYDNQAEPLSPSFSRASTRLNKATPMSARPSAHSRTGSASSNKPRPRRISIRDMTISSPIGTPDLAQSVAYNEEQPLSPRIYTPGPPPPTPGKKSSAASAREVERPSIRAPPPPTIRTNSANSGGQDNTLPFRQNWGHSQLSAPPTKTTFVERRESLLRPAPKTGMPVPYSPYMPHTPMTPITPSRLVTKEDRKKKKKQGGLKVVAEDDLVKSDVEMWGDSWRGR